MSGKFNLDKSMDKTSADVGVEKEPSNEKQLKKGRSTFRKLAENISLNIHAFMFAAWRPMILIGVYFLGLLIWYLLRSFYGL